MDEFYNQWVEWVDPLIVRCIKMYKYLVRCIKRSDATFFWSSEPVRRSPKCPCSKCWEGAADKWDPFLTCNFFVKCKFILPGQPSTSTSVPAAVPSDQDSSHLLLCPPPAPLPRHLPWVLLSRENLYLTWYSDNFDQCWQQIGLMRNLGAIKPP